MKSIVRKFKKGRLSRKEFLKIVGACIINAPKSIGFKDKDIIYEFYAHIAAKIERIIDRYTEYDNVKFETWFMKVLKREFLKYNKNNITKHNIELSFLKYINPHLQRTSETLPDDNEKLLFNYDCLTEREKSVVALKYAVAIENINVEKSAEIILEKIEKRKKIESRINKYHVKMIALQDQIRTLTCIESLQENKIRLQSLKRRKMKLVNSLSHISDLPTNKWVGKQLGITCGTVAAYLYKIRKKLSHKCIVTSNELSNNEREHEHIK